MATREIVKHRVQSDSLIYVTSSVAEAGELVQLLCLLAAYQPVLHLYHYQLPTICPPVSIECVLQTYIQRQNLTAAAFTAQTKLEGARETAYLRQVNFYRRPLFQ